MPSPVGAPARRTSTRRIRPTRATPGRDDAPLAPPDRCKTQRTAANSRGAKAPARAPGLEPPPPTQMIAGQFDTDDAKTRVAFPPEAFDPSREASPSETVGREGPSAARESPFRPRTSEHFPTPGGALRVAEGSRPWTRVSIRRDGHEVNVAASLDRLSARQLGRAQIEQHTRPAPASRVPSPSARS